jgi:hypothetical protein
MTTPAPTDAQRQDAVARAAKDKADAESLATQRSKSTRPPSDPVPRPVVASDDAKAKQYEADKKKYKESEACFAPYRSAAGSISPEAFQHCVEVREPAC